MNWQSDLKGDTLAWLLEPEDPGVRYLALRDLMDLPVDDPQLAEARQQAHASGPIAGVLAAMHPDGYWFKPGPGYSPKYCSTVWAMILLGQLGASVNCDARLEQACGYLLEHALTEYGQFTHSGAPSGTFDCLQGNLCNVLLDLGCRDPLLDAALDWMARSNTGEGLAPRGEKDNPRRFYQYKCAPNFACGVNENQPCAWGAVKVMLAFSKLPAERRTPQIERAIQTGLDFLLGVDPASAAYPTRREADKPSRDWWKFGFPVFYITDLLQNVEALARLGLGGDPRLANARQVILKKQDERGRWRLEFNYPSIKWANFGEKKQPNKWVTLRAARVLKLFAAAG